MNGALTRSLVGPALVAWIALRITTRLKIADQAQKEIEARVRDALHQAALNGLKFALSRAGMQHASILAGAIPKARRAGAGGL